MLLPAADNGSDSWGCAMSLKITGVDSVLRDFKAAPQKLEQELKPAVVEQARIVRDVAAQEAPVRTGELKGGIRVKRSKRRKGIAATVVSTAPHSPFVEFGTSRQEAEPFLIPAIEKQRGSAEAALDQAVERGVRKV